ncbi:MAG: GGDEF domain-containing protein [Alphaproteobacteria bacterium]|nr:GGDEF domain-containing protein [Alphaproteobacteria bacterium]
MGKTESLNHAESEHNSDYIGDILDLLNQTPNLVALFDSDDRLQLANPAYCAAYHCDSTEHLHWLDIMRVNYQNKRGAVIETQDIETWLTIAAARRATVPYRAFEAQLHCGKWIWVTETVSPLGYMLFQASDISSLRRGSRDLRVERDAARRASWTDPLTGVPNRRYVMDRFEEWLEMQRVQLHFGTHSLVVLDLDHFKHINDRYGHDQGDDVLISFCRTVVSSLRPFDLFGRIGGEEFLLLMPNCTLDVSRARLSLLQQKIRELGENSKNPAMKYTFSAGLVAVQSINDIHDTIRAADKLLYIAKMDGRDCLRW